jgi:hypothetical protein
MRTITASCQTLTTTALPVVKLAETGTTAPVHTQADLESIEAPGRPGQTPQVQKARHRHNKSRLQTQLHLKAISTPTEQKFGELGLGDGDASKGRNPYRRSYANPDTGMSQDGNVDALQSTKANRKDEGNIMELTTDEIIARLMNLSVKLDGEMRFDESSTVSQAIALIMTLRNAAERLRHPTNVSNNDELKAVIEWITENPS